MRFQIAHNLSFCMCSVSRIVAERMHVSLNECARVDADVRKSKQMAYKKCHSIVIILPPSAAQHLFLSIFFGRFCCAAFFLYTAIELYECVLHFIVSSFPLASFSRPLSLSLCLFVSLSLSFKAISCSMNAESYIFQHFIKRKESQNKMSGSQRCRDVKRIEWRSRGDWRWMRNCRVGEIREINTERKNIEWTNKRTWKKRKEK